MTIFLYGVFTYVAMLQKEACQGYVVEDKYKSPKVKIATMGGIAMFVGVISNW